MIAVKECELILILKIIKHHLPCATVVAFGSRIKKTHKDFSDLDLAIFNNNKEPLNFRLLGDLKEEFMNSDLPYRVDVIDYYNSSLEFRKIIDSKNVKIYPNE